MGQSGKALEFLLGIFGAANAGYFPAAFCFEILGVKTFQTLSATPKNLLDLQLCTSKQTIQQPSLKGQEGVRHSRAERGWARPRWMIHNH